MSPFASDPWIDRLAHLFREHPAWRAAARGLDRRAASNVFFTHRPGEVWHLERRGDETLLLPGSTPEPDIVFRFPPGAIARLEAVRGDTGNFAAELFALTLAEDPEMRVDLRIAARFTRLLRRGYVRLLLASGPQVRALGSAHGIAGVRDLQRLVMRSSTSQPTDWEKVPPAASAAATGGRPSRGAGPEALRAGSTAGRRG